MSPAFYVIYGKKKKWSNQNQICGADRGGHLSYSLYYRLYSGNNPAIISGKQLQSPCTRHDSGSHKEKYAGR